MPVSRTRAVSFSVFTFGFLLVVSLISACGTPPCACGTTVAPEWYVNPPEFPNYVYVVEADTNENMQAAIDTAIVRGRSQLSTTLERTLKRKTEAFRDALEDDQRRAFSVRLQQTVDSMAHNRKPDEKELYKDEAGVYRAFVIMEVSLSKFAQTLLAEIERHPALHERFQSSEEYQNLTTEPEETETK